MKKHIKTYDIYSILAFILGFSMSTYVVYVGVIGTTTFRFDMIVTILIFFSLLLKKSSITIIKVHFNYTIKIFTLFVIISGINAFILFNSLNYFDRFLKALLIYIVSILTYCCVILLKDHKEKIISGMIVGLIANMILSFVQYITFKSGNYFTLYNMFPQMSFYIPIYNFRTQGFFLEPSHMIQYVISTILLYNIFFKKNLKKIFITGFIILILLISKSANIVILVIMIGIYYLLKEKKIIITYKSIFISIILIFIIIVNFKAITEYLIQIDALGLIKTIMGGIDPYESGNGDRFGGMLKAIEMIKEYPLGIGFGMSKTLFDMSASAITSFNYMLTVQLEIGLFGAAIYILRIYVLGVILVLKKINNYQIALGLSIIGSEVCAILNGGYFGNALWILYALASIEIYSNKKISTDLSS